MPLGLFVTEGQEHVEPDVVLSWLDPASAIPESEVSFWFVTREFELKDDAESFAVPFDFVSRIIDFEDDTSSFCFNPSSVIPFDVCVPFVVTPFEVWAPFVVAPFAVAAFVFYPHYLDPPLYVWDQTWSVGKNTLFL